MSEVQSVQWFPGHMAKTRRKIGEDLKLVDIVAEILDSRIPQSSSNPVLQEIIRSKPRLAVFNKSDLADPKETDRWIAFYRSQKIPAVAVDCKTGKGVPNFYRTVQERLGAQLSIWKEKGMVGRPIRIMVLGIPNVGKSSLINRMIGGKAGKAEVQDRPGVTRQNRWFTIGKGFELLDTPGVLWPKFEDPLVGEHLAFTGAVKDEILDLEGLSFRLVELLMELYPQAVDQRYKIEVPKEPVPPGYEILEQIGRKRGMLLSKGEIDLERAAAMLLDEFRSGKLGRITLEQAPQKK